MWQNLMSLVSVRASESTRSFRASSTMADVLALTNALTKAGEPTGTPTHVMSSTWMTFFELVLVPLQHVWNGAQSRLSIDDRPDERASIHQ